MWPFLYVLWLWVLSSVEGVDAVSRNTISRDASFKRLNFYRLGLSANHILDVATTCAVACLEKQHDGSCAAYQWDAETRTCRLQETLSVTASAEDSVVMVRLEPADCLSDADCPADHSCLVSASGSLIHTCVAADCNAILAAGPSKPSGVYTIHAATPHPHQVWCDMDTDGGGWTVFLARLDGSVDFNRELASYQQGFGDAHGEYWLGLDTLHALTSSRQYQLRADISDWEGASVFSVHESMVVAGEAKAYNLTVGDLKKGEGGKGLSNSDGMTFSAKDIDRDIAPHVHCAQKYKGGFWYRKCQMVQPTALYYQGGAYTSARSDGMQWLTWAAHNDPWYSMKTITLKLRPSP
jgi:ficolin